MLKRYFTNPNLYFLLSIILLGVLFRVWYINSNYYFSGELGKELLYIRQFVVDKSLPLVGMATSHTWLYYGPLYYWVMIPIFAIFNGNPFILFWSALVVSILGLILNYIIFEKIINSKVALFSTLIQAISPLMIWQTRLSKLHVFFWVLMPIFTYLLYLMWNGKKKFVFLAGLIFGILFSFHFSQIPLMGVVVVLFYLKRKIYKIGDWVKFILGLIIPNITLIWQDKSLALWLPYRIVNFTEKSAGGTFEAINEYLGKTLFWDQSYWIIGTLFIGILLIRYGYVNWKKITTDFVPFYLVSSTAFMFLANIIHGVPPVHYFLPIFTTIPVVLAVYLAKVKFWPLVVLFIVLVNLPAFYKDPLFYKRFNGTVKNTDIVNYWNQVEIADSIVLDANGRAFSIKRIGPYDYFPEYYSQNYKYLLLWKGANLVEESQKLYTIVENTQGVYVKK